MLRPVLALVIAAVAIGPSFNGCKDLSRAVTQLAYPPVRDMRRSVVLIPQHVAPRPPDSLSVPIGGKEVMLDREAFVAKMVDPGASDAASIARGAVKYQRTCVPCHGALMKGDGPVAAKFMPPPNLLAPMTRARSDGFMYTYIRHGGAVMPSYGAQVSAAEAWDLIHYIRDLQKKNPQ